MLQLCVSKIADPIAKRLSLLGSRAIPPFTTLIPVRTSVIRLICTQTHEEHRISSSVTYAKKTRDILSKWEKKVLVVVHGKDWNARNGEGVSNSRTTALPDVHKTTHELSLSNRIRNTNTPEKSKLERLKKYTKKTKYYTPAVKIITSMLRSRTLNKTDGMLAVEIFTHAGKPDVCFQVLDYLHVRKHKVKAHYYNMTLTAFFATKNTFGGLQFFKEMKNRNIRPNTASYNTVLSIYEKKLNWERVIELLHEMEKNGVRRNTITYNRVISVCEKEGRWMNAIEFFRDMDVVGVPRTFATYYRTLRACAKGGYWKIAITVLREMEKSSLTPNAAIYKSVISACRKEGRWETAIQLLREMDVNGVPKDTITYNSTISACVEGGRWINAVKLLREMVKAGVPRDTITYNSAISACWKGRQWRTAITLLNEMKGAQIPKDAVTYNTAISACEKEGQSKSAIELLREASDAGIPRNALNYNSVIFACVNGGQLESAIKLLREMEDAGIPRDTNIYNCLMSVCVKERKTDQALKLFREMDLVGVEKDRISYSMIIEVLGNRGRMLGSIDYMYEDMIRTSDTLKNNWYLLKEDGLLDLHGHSQHAAKSAIRRLLRILSDQHRGSSVDEGSVHLQAIIVGRGNGSGERGRVLFSALQEQLQGEIFPPIKSYPSMANKGLLVLDAKDLHSWLQYNM
eukprot:CFRG6446T1